jgi:hypothetical protein
MMAKNRFFRKFVSLLAGILLLLLWVAIYWWLKKKSYKDGSGETERSQPDIANPKLHFDYERFATSPEEFKAWFDYIFEHLPFPVPVTSTIIGVLVFVGGLLLSLTIRFEREYVYTPAIYIGCFGIAWVLGVLRQASLMVHRVYEDLRPCFLVDDEKYKQVTSLWFSRMTSHTGNFSVSIFFFGLALIVVYIGVVRPDVAQSLNIKSLRPLFFFPPYWFTPDNLLLKATIIAYYGLCVALPLGTSFRLIVLNLLFLLDLQHMPVIPVAHIIRERWRGVVNLYVFISGSWFVGVALFGMVLFQTLDVLVALLLGSLGLPGILIFLIPQVVLTRYLARSYRLACDWSLQALNNLLGIELRERPRGDHALEISADAVSLKDLKDLANIVEAISKPERLIYSVEDFLVLVGGQVLLFASAFVQTLVQTFVQKFLIGILP